LSVEHTLYTRGTLVNRTKFLSAWSLRVLV
jgi:hypothetical protein